MDETRVREAPQTPFRKMGSELGNWREERAAEQIALRDLALELLPRMGHSWNLHGVATLHASAVARLLHWNEIYRHVLEAPGVICEFGVQWGATLATLINLRTIHEPFNSSRAIIGFDTFAGFPAVDSRDGTQARAGDYHTLAGYEEVLARILEINGKGAPNAHLRSFELVKGDASATFPAWLEAHPQTIVAMASFDFDLYTPTRTVLEHLLPHLVKGSVLVFDELNHPAFPGETLALAEVLGLNTLRLRRSKYLSHAAFAIFGD